MNARIPLSLLIVALLWASPPQVGGRGSARGQAAGQVQCRVTENGTPASGTLTLRKEGGQKTRSGACGDTLSVPAGRYLATVSLDGALDGPEQRQTIVVKAGALTPVEADFATAILEIRVEAEGRRAAGMAIIRKDGRQVGTLGSGVAAHISAGTYEIVARYRSQEKRFDAVALSGGERRQLVASF